MATGSMTLDRRLARLLIAGKEFTADDLTDEGNVTVDPAHRPNGRQNAIGSFFRTHASQGHIFFTGRVVKSKAPHRKGGMIRVWHGTGNGVAWAREVLRD